MDYRYKCRTMSDETADTMTNHILKEGKNTCNLIYLKELSSAKLQ
jgi:hypothetical protein